MTDISERPAGGAPADAATPRQTRKVAFASLVGTTVEWYDFYIYGTAAALVFPTVFFPDFSPAAGLLASLSTYAVGFAARPLGGMVFGHYGDRVGRKKMLVISLLAMGIATLAMGLVPGFAQIGILAPILVVGLRFVQGVAVGGEWGGAVLMAVEHAPPGKRGFYGSWPQIGSPLGLVLSTAAFSAVGFLPDEDFLAWGWRLPFLASALLIIVGLVVRLRIMESPVFAQMEAAGSTARMPVKDAITRHTRSVFGAAGAFVIINTVFYLVTVLGLSWATTHVGIPRGTFLGAVLVAAVVMCLTVPAFGALSDRLGRKPVFGAGAVLVALFAFPLFWLIESGSTPLLFLGIIVIMGIGHPLMYGPQAALYSEMFPPEVRYSGASLGYQIGGMLGGLVPLLASALLVAYDNAAWPMSALLAVIAVISLGSLLSIRARYADEVAS
ncbi:MFS transporter [Pseudonocardia hydrocarbonoxydans]|uniref:Putative proline/betaine transporter n=1 Tax=Pseudonocardia hydrocarbonoxydans TaxID=76726 RepID=A0A4Y3WTJ7_9PSEU|nr:MFS transporter [Pseudonocardia hydrocarbonoxydans]GEC21069.1 MFS transporter [Pseudonocardia hydrocarbonoxydans]